MRILIRPRLPLLALIVLAPAIPELLTGSTPITTLVVDPVQFAISWLGDMGLYGTGALLIREFVVFYRKGWASTLLLGGAYGIAEEGIAVHTFFEPAGRAPVGALGSYGHAVGVNWLWALGLTGFHSVYSIALPILLVQLWFPHVKDARWLDRGAVGLVAAIYLFVVAFFAFLVGHGPSPVLLGFFVGLALGLAALAYSVPADLLHVRPGPARIGPWGLAFSGTLFFDGWVIVIAIAGARAPVPAWLAAGLLVLLSISAVLIVVRRVGTENLDRSEFFFAVGMMAVLFAWDVPVEFSVPGILLVAAVFAYFLYRLYGRLERRDSSSVPSGALGSSAPGSTGGLGPPDR